MFILNKKSVKIDISQQNKSEIKFTTKI